MSIRRYACVGACLLLVLALTIGGAYLAPAQEPAAGEQPRTFGKANAETIEAFVVLLRLRHDLFLRWKETGQWPDDKAANEALAGHGRYWETQLKAGRAVLAGGMKGDFWDNVALIIFEAGSEAEAQEIVKNDPAVKAYVFQAQVRPFDVHFITNKHQQDR
jgi:uncharacterized protein YciI